MSYLSLHKLYYQNPADYEAIYQKRFTSPYGTATGSHLLRQGGTDHGQLCEQSGKSRMTVQKRLDALPEGILTREKNGKAWVYKIVRETI